MLSFFLTARSNLLPDFVAKLFGSFALLFYDISIFFLNDQKFLCIEKYVYSDRKILNRISQGMYSFRNTCFRGHICYVEN